MRDNYHRKADYLRLSVTDRCNLRCRYCMPEGGVPHLPHSEILTYEEMLRFAAAAASAGISKIRLTGGEPLVRRGIEDLVGGLASLVPRLDISLTTNGLLLEKCAGTLRSRGLRRVNISIDTLDARNYRELTRGGDLEAALQGVSAALSAGLKPVKINAVLLRGINDSEKEILSFIELSRRLPVFIRFIEYMSPCGNLDESFFVPMSRVREILEGLGGAEPCAGPEGGGPASYLRLRRFEVTVGLISPVTSHFCENCNRLRLTADGKLKSCLLSPTEVDVKELLRSGAADDLLIEAMRVCLEDKPHCRSMSGGPNRMMSGIGG